MKKENYYLWLNPMREMLGLAPIPYTMDAVAPLEADDSWLPHGGLDYSTGDELWQMPSQQRQMLTRRTRSA